MRRVSLFRFGLFVIIGGTFGLISLTAQVASGRNVQRSDVPELRGSIHILDDLHAQPDQDPVPSLWT